MSFVTHTYTRCSADTKRLKVCQENIPHTITRHELELLIQDRMDQCFQVVFAKFELYSRRSGHSLNKVFSSLLLPSLCEHVPSVSAAVASRLDIKI